MSYLAFPANSLLPLRIASTGAPLVNPTVVNPSAVVPDADAADTASVPMSPTNGASTKSPKKDRPAVAGAASRNCDHGQRRQSIVEFVLAEVFLGKLRPGQHLVTQQLAERFAVSHTPVREALISLAGIGIIDLVPNRGAIVRTVTEKDVREICQVRKVLECEAVRLACGRIPLATLHALNESLTELTRTAERPQPLFIQQARQIDSRLHDLVAESSGNGFLTQELNRLKLLFRAFRDVAWEHDEARDDYHRLAEEAHEHAAIVQPLLAGDGKEAARAMSRHIRSGLKYWSRALPMSTKERPYARPNESTGD